ncbi:hypothetical protein Droror1_Dr00007441 [Drosera rotundifolia]
MNISPTGKTKSMLLLRCYKYLLAYHIKKSQAWLFLFPPLLTTGSLVSSDNATSICYLSYLSYGYASLAHSPQLCLRGEWLMLRSNLHNSSSIKFFGVNAFFHPSLY